MHGANRCPLKMGSDGDMVRRQFFVRISYRRTPFYSSVWRSSDELRFWRRCHEGVHLMVRKLLSGVVAVGLAAQFGCYNTYSVSLEELAKAQETAGKSSAVKLKTAADEEVVVTESSKIGVTDTDGAYHAISPFNFTLTSSQLVAPDEDFLIPVSAIQTGNVKVVSGSKTAWLVAGAIVALVGAGAVIAFTAEEKTDFGE